VQDIVWSLSRALVRAGHAVTLITTEHPEGLTAEEVEGVSLRYLPVPARSLALTGLASAWRRASAALVDALHRERPISAIHSQSFCGLHLARHLLGVPVVATLHGTHVDELRTRARLARESLPHSALAAMRYGVLWLLMLSRYLKEGGRLGRSRAVIATSREQRAVLLRWYRLPPGIVYDVWNGIDVRQFAPSAPDPAFRADLGVGPGDPLVLTVARLYQEKGIQHLLRAWPRIQSSLPRARLMVVGDGGYRRNLEQLTGSLGIASRVRFVGSVPLESLPLFYAASDAFVNPTVRINGYDLTILQAMAMARPVVVSNIGSVPTVVTDGEGGFLVPPGDPNALANTVVRVLGDPAGGAAMGARARRVIEQRFSLESMVSGTIAVYQEAIELERDSACPR
jgi:glycosyltransferase involved in cell wall biosynthesis